MPKYMGLDVSTSCTGISIIDEQNNLIYYQAYKHTGDTLEEKAADFEMCLIKLVNLHMPAKFFLEDAAKKFTAGKTTANTMNKLIAFNFLVRFLIYKNFNKLATPLNVISARSKLGIKIPRGLSQRKKKRVVIDHIQKMFPTFTYILTRKGNPAPGTDDIADSCVIVVAGKKMLDNSV